MNNTWLGISIWIRKDHGESNPKRYAMLGWRYSLIMKRSISLSIVREHSLVLTHHVTWYGMVITWQEEGAVVTALKPVYCPTMKVQFIAKVRLVRVTTARFTVFIFTTVIIFHVSSSHAVIMTYRCCFCNFVFLRV